MSQTITVPELEEIAKSFHPRDWTEETSAIVRTYYGRVPTETLQTFLKEKYNTYKSLNAIRKKAQAMSEEL